MEELFSNLNLDDLIEVDVATPTAESSQAPTPKPAEVVNTESQKKADAKAKESDSTLIEVNVEPIKEKSSLHTEQKKEVKTGVTSMKEEVKGIMLGENTQSEVKTEEKQTPESQSAEDKNSPSSSPFVVFAKVLHEEGVLSSFDESKDYNSVEGLTAAISEEITLNVQDYKDSLPEAIKEIIDNYEEGIPLDQLIANKSRQIEFDNIKDE